jgi:hypothetical protein
MLVLATALYLLLLARQSPRIAPLAGLPLALGLIIRPTNVVPLLVFTTYVLWRYRRQAIGYLLLVALVLAPFVRLNLVWYGRPLSPYYYPSAQPLGSLWAIPATAAGHLVSPNRGLLVFSPVLGFALLGAIAKLRTRAFDALDLAVTASLAGHFAIISGFGQWWAGHSFGPRLVSDVVPLLMYFMIFAFGALGEIRTTVRRPLAVLLAVLCLWSVFVHLRAATTRDVWAWNGTPVSIDERPERAWDWRDLQVLRGLVPRDEKDVPP